MFGGRTEFLMKLPSLSARELGVFGRGSGGPLGVGPMSLHVVSVLRAKGIRPQGGHIALRGAVCKNASPGGLLLLFPGGGACRR